MCASACCPRASGGECSAGWASPSSSPIPKFDTIAARYAASRELNAAIDDLFAPQTMEALVSEGQARGVPMAAVLTPAETLASEHFRDVGALTGLQIAPGVTVAVPTGPFVVDGRHAGVRHPAPPVGADDAAWTSPADVAHGTATVTRPFDGLRILDLGVIVAGGELGRLFADLGAEVIKIESAAYPDGLRQTGARQAMSRSWALTHRNEYSLGLDLRHPEGAELFGRLVADADAVFANFKPGTLASLGFSYERLREINPGIVLAESSAFGATGPWSARMGYGPLVRATTGRHVGCGRHRTPNPTASTTPPPCSPIMSSRRITAIAALAALVRRDRTGAGAHVHISQAEAAVNQLATSYVTEACRAAQLAVDDSPAVHGVYPCDGDDEWCVISVRSDADRAALAETVGRNDLPTERSAFIADVSEWTATRDKAVVAETLQRAGIPAAPMNRAVDVLADPQVTPKVVHRHGASAVRRADAHRDRPGAVHPYPAGRNCGPPRCRANTPARSARSVLGLTTEEIDRLIADGVLFTSMTREAVMDPEDAGAGRLRPGQPARREPRDVEPVDLMAAAARAAADPRVLRGRRLGARRQPAVLALPRSRDCFSAQRIRRRRRGHPLHRRRRQRAADAGQPGVPGHPGGPRRRRPDRRRRDLAHPNASAQPRSASRTGRAGRVGAVRGGRRRRRRRWPGPPRLRINLDRPAYVYPMFEQALRIAAGESPDEHRRRIGELWSQFSAVARDNPHAWSRERAVGRRDLAAERRQPDDQLALHQADELQQHGRSGRGR